MLKENLKTLRKNKGLSQEELSVNLNVVRQTISKWEQGETYPDIKQAKELSKIFNVSLDELTGNDIKTVLLERTPNTEKLAGIIIKILKIIGILFIVFLIIAIIAFIFFSFNHKNIDERVDRNISITCTLHNEEYNYEFGFEEETGQIIYAGGDGYLNNIIGIDKYSDIHQALDNIEEYVKNHNGTCTRSNK